MGDENQRFARITQGFHDLEEFVHFLRGQHGSGFIQDQDVGFTKQDFDNFNPLLDTHG